MLEHNKDPLRSSQGTQTSVIIRISPFTIQQITNILYSLTGHLARHQLGVRLHRYENPDDRRDTRGVGLRQVEDGIVRAVLLRRNSYRRGESVFPIQTHQDHDLSRYRRLLRLP